MPYVRVWIHFIWATKRREKIITPSLKPQLLQHIKENARKQQIYLDTINAVEDHAHALISLKATQTISQVAHLLKGESSHWVNENQLAPGKFEWQKDYIALSVCESQVNKVREYIRRQEEHHRKKSFSEEYREFLDKLGFK